MRGTRLAYLLALPAMAGSGLTGCSTAHALPAPTTHIGRTLVQTVILGESEFSVCATISNANNGGFYLTSGLQGQINFVFSDAQGSSVVSTRDIMPGPPVAPPPSGEISSYFILEGHSRLETCRHFSYDNFSQDDIHIQSRFQSWLKRDFVIPEPVQRMSIDRQFIGRPLYYDEVLLSNLCALNRRTRIAHCS